MTEQNDWVKIERTFAAPIEKVWDMWAKPELFASWYGPNGMTIPVAEMDVQIGGTRKICMEMVTPDRTMQMWFTGVYKEITPHTRLVYTESMCDADGTLIPRSAMGMPEGTPDITEVIIDLREDGDKTHMSMVHIGVPSGTAGEGGWNQAIDKLAAALG